MMMLLTWTMVLFLNGQPFVYPQELSTLEECSKLEEQAITLLLPVNISGSDNHASVACGRTDLSVYKPAKPE